MKTKFILHGGYAGKPNKQNDKFFKEILSVNKIKLNILLVYFARYNKDYERMKSEDFYQFNKNNKNKILNFEIAESGKKKFVRQTKKANIIYLHGGKNSKLLKKLKEYKNFPKLIKGKIVAGESAGAYVLSSYFYSKSEEGWFKGLGFVPVKIICHYVGENRDELHKCPSDLRELLLKDFEYEVFKM